MAAVVWDSRGAHGSLSTLSWMNEVILPRTVANNVNQLARYANTEGRFPAEAEGVVAEYRSLSARIDDTIRKLAGA